MFRSIDSEVLAAHVGENNGRTKTMGTKLLSEEPETRKFSGKPESLEKTEAETIISQFFVSGSILRDTANKKSVTSQNLENV